MKEINTPNGYINYAHFLGNKKQGIEILGGKSDSYPVLLFWEDTEDALDNLKLEKIDLHRVKYFASASIKDEDSFFPLHRAIMNACETIIKQC